MRNRNVSSFKLPKIGFCNVPPCAGVSGLGPGYPGGSTFSQSEFSNALFLDKTSN